MSAIDAQSVDLVVTSPPYPMIQMWDDLFRRQDAAIGRALEKGRGRHAFEMMHAALMPVWREVYRVLKPGGIACINIGDAVRSVGETFCLYPNQGELLCRMTALGFSALPQILWRKPTNSPTKFMGSGMLPPSAYVTLEHEAILILRKGANRLFKDPQEKRMRRQSAFFWEERNRWFSDVWTDLKGTAQSLSPGHARRRSAAFPLEVPYRLINMFSIKDDTVLDPFAGTGTTSLAAMAAGRNSVGFELEPEFRAALVEACGSLVDVAARRIGERLRKHREFVREREEGGYRFNHRNVHYGFPVMTSQEKELLLSVPVGVEFSEKEPILVHYSAQPRPAGESSAGDEKPRSTGQLFLKFK